MLGLSEFPPNVYYFRYDLGRGCVTGMNGKKRQTAQVFTRAANTYGRVGPDFFSYFGRRLVDLAGVVPGATVLDAASGAGAILLPAAQRVGSHGRVAGIDLSQGMIDRLRQEIIGRRLGNAAACLMDAEELGFRAATFDCVLCGFALDGFLHPERAVSEFYRVLQPRGRLGLTISSGWWWETDERWQWHGELIRRCGVSIDSTGRRFATTEQVEQALVAGGFVQASVLEEDFSLVFDDAGHWWRWAWSHGYRRVLESMRPETLEQYQEACFEYLTRQSEAGAIHGRLEVLLGTAAKPGQPAPVTTT